MLHFNDCVAPGAAAAISARISRNLARASVGAAAMYPVTVVRRGMGLSPLRPAGVRIRLAVH